jgi:hypothetical protein
MTNDKKTNVIPDAVLSLLKERWMSEQQPYETAALARAGAFSEPRYFSYEPGHPAPGSNTVAGGELSFDVAQALSDHPDFVGLVKEQRGFVQVNEFAEFALSEFLGEVYAAWDKLRERLEAAKRGQATPAARTEV